MQGNQVKTLEDLQALSRARRSVIVPDYGGFSKPRPATFVLNQQGRQLLRMFQSGMYVYVKAKKRVVPFHEAVRRHGRSK